MTLPYTKDSAIRAQKGRPRLLHQLGRVLVIPSFLGAMPFTLRGLRVVLAPWKMIYSIFCSSLVLLMSTYAVLFPNPLLTKSTFSMFVYCIQAVPFSFTPLASLYCIVSYSGHINSAVANLIKADSILFKLNATPKMRYNCVYGTSCVLTVVTFSLGKYKCTQFLLQVHKHV